MYKDIKLWCKSCIQRQRSKIDRHAKSPLGEYGLPIARFSQVHLDIVGPLPPSKDFVYVLTCFDRFPRWPEDFPMRNKIFAGWVSRFGAPEIVTTDQESQFQPDIFRSLFQILEIQKIRTVAYNPKCIGAVERFHRSLKSAIK
ncbi:hypothetical protein AVEN_103323-1 [Araneus ventricosus]|uniref:Integrase catalytic domain-containing protein n=1 Tax=Araneus ventricosus TaxID=182803 RepID=A0A4Y2LVU2_ARAVE|nr:hypothetical protein AVEN_103323-1 [Araneus ventricosus]